jgi:hypothetical protein
LFVDGEELVMAFAEPAEAAVVVAPIGDMPRGKGVRRGIDIDMPAGPCIVPVDIAPLCNYKEREEATMRRRRSR